MATLNYVESGGFMNSSWAPPVPLSADPGETVVLVIGSYTNGGGPPRWTVPPEWIDVPGNPTSAAGGSWDWWAFEFDGDASQETDVTIDNSGMAYQDALVALVMYLVLAPGERIAGAFAGAGAGDFFAQIGFEGSTSADGTLAAFALGWVGIPT